jgi:hypothetical protein
MIDPNKSLIIFSHPRSGSTWFQSALPHFNTMELFNLSLMYIKIPERNQFKNSIGNFYTLDYPKHRYNEIGIDHEYDDRFKMYNDLENKHSPISVRIHTYDATDKVIDFLRTKDANYVLIERKDKISTFWSMLVSWTTLKFHFFNPEFQNITVSKEGFDMVADIMINFQGHVEKLKQIFPIQHIYYEDVLNYELSDWWVHPKNRITIQNAAKLTTILNLDEVMGWIEQIDLLNRI